MEGSCEKIKELGLLRKAEYSGLDEKSMMDLSRSIASDLHGGEVILLVGDLGAGKTTVTRSILKELGVPASKVRSPTFNIVNTYEGNHVKIYHIDTYRISPFELYDLGFYDYFDGESVVIIEWADKVLEDIDKADFFVKIDFSSGDKRKRDVIIYKK